MAINTNNQDLQNTTFDKVVGSEPQVLDFPVDSVNGKTGDVVLDIEDIGNLQGELDTIGLEIDSALDRLDVIENKEEPESVVTSVNGLVDNVELDGNNIFSDTRTINVRFLDVENSIDSITNSLENPERVLKVLGKIDLATAQDLIGTEDATLSGGEVYIVIDDIRPLEFEVLIYDNKWLYLNTPIVLPDEIELNRLVVSSIGSIATLTIEKDVTGQNASFLNIYNKTEVNDLLTDFESELDLAFEEIEQRLNNIENTGIGVRSFNGETGDLIKHGANIPAFENSEESIKEYIDNQSNTTGNVAYTKREVVTSELIQGSYSGYAGALQSFNNTSSYFIPSEDSRGIVMTQDVSEMWIHFSSRISSSENMYLLLNGKAVAGQSSGTTSFVNTFSIRNLQVGDLVEVGSSTAWEIKLYDGALDKSDNHMYYTIIKDDVIEINDVLTKGDVIREQDYVVTFEGAVVGNGTWQSVPLTYLNGNGNNVYDPDYFASINLNGDIVLPSDFSIKCNKVGTTGTAYILGASNDVLMRVLLSPPNADDISLNKNQLTSSIILGEGISVKSATQDLVNLACRDLASKLSDGTLRDNYVLRVQFKSTSDFVIENDPKNNNIDFVVYPL